MRKKAKSLYLILMVSVLLALGTCFVVDMCQADTLEPHPIRSSFHDELRERFPDGLPWGILVANDVNFREGPGLQYRAICQQSYGTAVEVLDEQDGWLHVIHWTHVEPMWVWGEYLNIINTKED